MRRRRGPSRQWAKRVKIQARFAREDEDQALTFAEEGAEDTGHHAAEARGWAIVNLKRAEVAWVNALIALLSWRRS